MLLLKQLITRLKLGTTTAYNEFEKQMHVLYNCRNYSLLRFVKNRLNFYIKFIQAEAVVAKEIFGLTKVLIVRYVIATGTLFAKMQHQLIFHES